MFYYYYFVIKFIILFDFFCIIKRFFTNNIFSINSSLLRKFKNKIPSHTFLMGEISLGFDEVKLTVYEVKIPIFNIYFLHCTLI